MKQLIWLILLLPLTASADVPSSFKAKVKAIDDRVSVVEGENEVQNDRLDELDVSVENGVCSTVADNGNIVSWGCGEHITTQCADGIDNDGDGVADFPMDPGCENAQDDDETDPPPPPPAFRMVASSHDFHSRQKPSNNEVRMTFDQDMTGATLDISYIVSSMLGGSMPGLYSTSINGHTVTLVIRSAGFTGRHSIAMEMSKGGVDGDLEYFESFPTGDGNPGGIVGFGFDVQ